MKAIRYSIYRCPRCADFEWDKGKREGRCRANSRLGIPAPLVDDGKMKDNECEKWRKK